MRTPLVIGTVLVCTVCGCGGNGYRNDNGMMGTPTPVSSPDVGVVTILGQQGMLSFDPNPAHIAPGAIVVWHNLDSATHRIVMNDGSFDSGAIAPGNSSSVMRLGAASPQATTLPSLKLRQNIEWVERETIRRAIESAAGVKKDAAELMGISQRALSYYLAKYRLD